MLSEMESSSLSAPRAQFLRAQFLRAEHPQRSCMHSAARPQSTSKQLVNGRFSVSSFVSKINVRNNDGDVGKCFQRARFDK
jgi:hypothetical protein